MIINDLDGYYIIYRNIKQNRIRKRIAKRFGLPINVFESWLRGYHLSYHLSLLETSINRGFQWFLVRDEVNFKFNQFLSHNGFLSVNDVDSAWQIFKLTAVLCHLNTL